MVKVELLKDIGGSGSEAMDTESGAVGSVVPVSEARAERWIRKGIAKPLDADEPKPKAANARKQKAK